LPPLPRLADAPGAGEVPATSTLRLPAPGRPEVSVVIPAYGQLASTLRSLGALAAAASAAAFEAIVVDDGSPPEVAAELERVAGLRLVRQAENLGYVAACRRGAEEARGKWLVLLNNDTVVTDGWLDRLLETARRFPRAGAVGAALLAPDGRLQEAGGIVWRDGSATNAGRGSHPDAPPWAYAREVDYCSGACLLLSRELFLQLGGFDEAFAPAYYEDVDLAFRLRERGLAVVVQPLARVFHFEGTTAGTDPSRGAKRFQVEHRARFVARWPEALAAQPARGADPEAVKDRGIAGRCLVVDHVLPTPDRDAGSARMRAVLGAVRDLGFQPTLAASDLAGGPSIDELRGAGIEVLARPFERSLARHLARLGERYDVAVLSRLAVAERWASLVRRRCPRARLVFDTVDLRSRREAAGAHLTGDAATATRAARTRQAELAQARSADVVLATSEEEARELEARGARSVVVVPTFYDLPAETATLAERRDLLFLGGFRHLPNVDAVTWFVREVLPAVRSRLPDVRLRIVGQEPPPEIRALAAPEVEILGHVPLLEPLLSGARLSVAPIRWGAGVAGKVHLSLAWGLPCVGTSLAARGLGVTAGREMLVADEPADFADAVVALYGDPERWAEVAERGRRLVAERFSRERFVEAVRQALGA
jgi:GT2 family glycosyltransferase